MHISSVPVTFCGSLKVLVTWNNVKYKLLKYDSHIILNDIDSKHSSNRSFRSHYSYPQVTVFCTLLAVTFFPSKQFFLHFFKFKADNLYTEVMQWRYRSSILFKRKRGFISLSSSAWWKYLWLNFLYYIWNEYICYSWNVEKLSGHLPHYKFYFVVLLVFFTGEKVLN